MSAAKNNFINRITSFQNIVSPPDPSDSVLNSMALTEKDHNDKVKMLRNGMAIIGYTILEDFIKRRVGEVLKEISKTNVNFNSLPRKLKEAATSSALKGIQVRAENLKRNSEEYLSFIQNETLCISSTKNSIFEISEYSLGWDKSNVAAEDITNFLNVFNIEGGWNSIQSISSAIDISLTDPNQIFKNAASRRHNAAHDANAESLLTDLQNYVSQSKVIAFGFDALLSKSLKHIKDNNIKFLKEEMKTNFNQLEFRFLIEQNGKWKEFSKKSKKAFKVKPLYSDLFNDAFSRSKINGEILIIKTVDNQLVNWHIN